MSEDQTKEEMLENLNWLTTQNRNLLSRVQQLEAILNAVQERSPEALSFLQEAQARQEMGGEVRSGEEIAEESETEETDEA
jgi:vacuolar-type H+-ATPase subunit I/STV1